MLWGEVAKAYQPHHPRGGRMAYRGPVRFTPRVGVESMDYDQIAYEVSDRIATLTLDRPEKLNAMTDEMRDQLLDALERVDRDDDVRVLILTGRGRGFCAGRDLSSGGGTFDYASTGEDAAHHRDGGGLITLRMFDLKKPIIAAINGPAVGVGVTMTLAADIRMAADTARFGFVFSRRGIVNEAASSWFLPRAVGLSQALEWVFSGRVFGAEEALKAGLVRSVHPAEELLPAARALGAEIAQNTSAISVAIARQLLWRLSATDHPMDAHRAESQAMFFIGQSADAREGVDSFLEKRAPAFPMRVSRDLPELPWAKGRPFA